MIGTGEAIQQFTAAMMNAGIHPPETIEADKQLHRFGTNRKRDDDAGYYILHADGIPAGQFGDWRSDVSQFCKADIGRELSPDEEQANKRRMEALRREREADKKRRHDDARERAQAIWKAAKPASQDHPYLKAKGISQHRLREHKGR